MRHRSSLGVLRWLSALALLASLCGCTPGDEVARIPSPDHSLVAVVVEDSAGATTDYWYDVCIVRPKESTCDIDIAAAVIYGAQRSGMAYGVDVVWTGDDHVIVSYMTAKRVTKHRPEVRPGDKRVTVELRAGVADPKGT